MEVLLVVVLEAFKDLAFPPPTTSAWSGLSPTSLGLTHSLGLQGWTVGEVKNIGLFLPPSLPTPI